MDDNKEWSDRLAGPKAVTSQILQITNSLIALPFLKVLSVQVHGNQLRLFWPLS